LQFGVGCIPSNYEHYVGWVRAAEETGFREVGTGDSPGLWTDPFVTLALAATNTRDIRLSVVGTNPVTRHPLTAASAIESVQLLSGGRCRYALGSGDSSVATIGHRRADLSEVERYGRAVQELCRGGTAEYDGHEIRLRWAAAPVPVYLCAEGPKTQALAGRFADGAVLYNGITEDVVRASVAQIEKGAMEAGRQAGDLDLSWTVIFHLTDDVAAGVDAIKLSLAGTANRAFRHSLTDKLVPERFQAGFRSLQQEYKSTHHQQLDDHSWNASLVDRYGLTDYLANRFAIVGPPGLCIERLLELESYGISRITLSLISRDLPGQIETMRRLANAVFPSIKME
jgi:5,10-methylenetetrahydromethanopterin reductase